MSEKRILAWVVAAVLTSGPYLLAGSAGAKVPEPAALLLLAVGAAGIGLWRWKGFKNPRD